MEVGVSTNRMGTTSEMTMISSQYEQGHKGIERMQRPQADVPGITSYNVADGHRMDSTKEINKGKSKEG